MKTTTLALIRAVLSNKLSVALKAANAPVPSNEKAVITDIADYSDALVDLMSSTGPEPTDAKAAFAALDVIGQHTKELADLDAHFEQGAGKGSSAHKMIRRLRGIAESALPEVTEVQPQS